MKQAVVAADKPLCMPINSPPVSLRLNAKRGIVTGLMPPVQLRIRECP
jgi:hypothetical protein